MTNKCDGCIHNAQRKLAIEKKNYGMPEPCLSCIQRNEKELDQDIGKTKARIHGIDVTRCVFLETDKTCKAYKTLYFDRRQRCDSNPYCSFKISCSLSKENKKLKRLEKSIRKAVERYDR